MSENLAGALAAFQVDLPRVGKDNTASVRSDKGSYTYRYADLADLSPLVLPLLAKHGLAWSTRPTLTDDGRFVLRYALSHVSGESEGGDYPLPNPTSSPQVLGSAITYARRYALCAMTGVAPGDDDDDAAAAQKKSGKVEEKPKDFGSEPTAEDAIRVQIRNVAKMKQFDLEAVAEDFTARMNGADIRTATAPVLAEYRDLLREKGLQGATR